MSRAIQQEKIFILMLRQHKVKQWFYPYDFMRENMGDLFVGYEASARFSELAKDYPFAFESERDGKYFKRRLRLENAEELYDKLPHEFARHFVREGVIK